MSATRKAFRKVRSIRLPLYQLAGAAGGLDLLSGGLREAVRVDGEGLRELAAPEHLDRHVALRREPLLTQRVGGHLGTRVEARIEVVEVHGLRLRPELLERHRLLHMRAAQLAHPHVDRRLTSLEVHALLRARARAGTLVAASGGLAGARALATADALARLARAGRRLQGVQTDALFVVSHRTPLRGAA